MYVYIYIYEENRQKSIPNVMNLFMMAKSTLKRFGFIKPPSGLYKGGKKCCLNHD